MIGDRDKPGADLRLDRVRGEGLTGGLVVADSRYGASGPFRDGLAGRGLHDIVGVTDETGP
jgi:hypothetical protein